MGKRMGNAVSELRALGPAATQDYLRIVATGVFPGGFVVGDLLDHLHVGGEGDEPELLIRLFRVEEDLDVLLVVGHPLGRRRSDESGDCRASRSPIRSCVEWARS